MWYCFGHGEGGNVVQFLMQMESISFREAIEKLASKIGYGISYE